MPKQPKVYARERRHLGIDTAVHPVFMQTDISVSLRNVNTARAIGRACFGQDGEVEGELQGKLFQAEFYMRQALELLSELYEPSAGEKLGTSPYWKGYIRPRDWVESW